ncbi:hypothetical protein T12_13453, partial [Trichinella patagoniensis]
MLSIERNKVAYPTYVSRSVFTAKCAVSAFYANWARQLCKFAIDVVLRLCFSANLVVIVTPQEERNLNDNVKQFFTLNSVMS